MRRSIAAACLMMWVSHAPAQIWRTEPAITVCEAVLRCEHPKFRDLPAPQQAHIAAFMKRIPARTSRTVVEANFGEPPFNTTPTVFQPGGRQVLLLSAVWMLTAKRESEFDPHVDVLFADDKVISFRIWTEQLKKRIEVAYAE